MALVPRPVSSIASGPFSACAQFSDHVLRVSRGHPPCPRTGPPPQPLRPRRGIFLGGTGPPTSVFDRERPILRVRQFPDDCLRACGGHLPCATDPRPASSPARRHFSGWHWSPDQCLRSRATHAQCAPSPPTDAVTRECPHKELCIARPIQTDHAGTCPTSELNPITGCEIQSTGIQHDQQTHISLLDLVRTRLCRFMATTVVCAHATNQFSDGQFRYKRAASTGYSRGGTRTSRK